LSLQVRGPEIFAVSERVAREERGISQFRRGRVRAEWNFAISGVVGPIFDLRISVFGEVEQVGEKVRFSFFDLRISGVLVLVFFGSFCYDSTSTGQAKAKRKARGQSELR